MKEKLNICVFGASSERIENTYNEASYTLGKLLAQSGWNCITGAGCEGLMRAVSDGALENGGTVTGIIPQFMVDNGWQHETLTKLIVTKDMHERKETMAKLADAFVAMPGGCGTIEELMEMYTWRQLKIMNKPIVVLNTIGYWEPLIKMIERCETLGFARHDDKKIWSIAKTPKEVISLIECEIKQLRKKQS